MTRKIWIWLLVSVGAGLVTGVLILAAPAHCTWCPTYKCYAPCGGGCVCITPPGTTGGSCYGVERVPSLISKGWRVIE